MIKLCKKLSLVFLFGLFFSLAACVSSQTEFTAANEEDEDIGLGGTGMLADADSSVDSNGTEAGSSGLGGTGLVATGILGEITGFGSIFVNGIEIEYDADTESSVNGVPAKLPELHVGDVVEVLTTDDKNHTEARMINLRHEIIGVVESVEPETHSFTVHGQTVIHKENSSQLPEVGQTVAVAGFRIDEQTVLSTRISAAVAGQSLLRTHTGLPFSQQAKRWLVQTNVQKGKAALQVDDTEQLFDIDDKAGDTANDRWAIKTLQLRKSAQEKYELEQVIDPLAMPRGKQMSSPEQPPLRGPMPMQHQHYMPTQSMPRTHMKQNIR